MGFDKPFSPSDERVLDLLHGRAWAFAFSILLVPLFGAFFLKQADRVAGLPFLYIPKIQAYF